MYGTIALLVVLAIAPWMIFSIDEVESIPFEVFLIIIGVSIVSVIGALIKWLRRRKNRITQIQLDVEELKKVSWRVQKTLLIMAQIMDDTLEKTHPDLRADLETIAQELLDHTPDKRR